MARVLAGAAVARAIRGELAVEIAALGGRGVRPGLGVVLVGDDPSSAVYVRSKTRACVELGLHHEMHHLPAGATTEAGGGWGGGAAGQSCPDAATSGESRWRSS